jgi:histidinol dehydrogenase
MRTLEGREAADYIARNLVFRSAVVDPKAEQVARRILADVHRRGDASLLPLARKFDGLQKDQPVLVSREEMEAAWKSVSPAFRSALKVAARNIRQFAEWQKPKPWMRTMQPGLRVGQKVEPIASVGCYVPGGRYPLPSSLLMTVIPAQVAGVPRIQVASPRPAPETLAAATMLGIERFYRIGGAQAVAAFAYGTESVERVDKIVGPGNSFVTAAKKLAAFDCSIDFLAGPTEIVYVAHTGDPAFIASDLVAQAEHDPLTLSIFITASRRLAKSVAKEAIRMAADNPIAKQSLESTGVVLIAKDKADAMQWANQIGAEHITVSRDDLKATTSAGSIFVGDYSPQSLGDYASGPNHTLPTGNVARYRGGLSVYDYLKLITVQEVTKAGLKKIGPVVTLLAEAEGLKAHANSVRVRLGGDQC